MQAGPCACPEETQTARAGVENTPLPTLAASTMFWRGERADHLDDRLPHGAINSSAARRGARVSSEATDCAPLQVRSKYSASKGAGGNDLPWLNHTWTCAQSGRAVRAGGSTERVRVSLAKT